MMDEQSVRTAAEIVAKVYGETDPEGIIARHILTQPTPAADPQAAVEQVEVDAAADRLSRIALGEESPHVIYGLAKEHVRRNAYPFDEKVKQGIANDQETLADAYLRDLPAKDTEIAELRRKVITLRESLLQFSFGYPNHGCFCKYGADDHRPDFHSDRCRQAVAALSQCPVSKGGGE